MLATAEPSGLVWTNQASSCLCERNSENVHNFGRTLRLRSVNFCAIKLIQCFSAQSRQRQRSLCGTFVRGTDTWNPLFRYLYRAGEYQWQADHPCKWRWVLQVLFLSTGTIWRDLRRPVSFWGHSWGVTWLCDASSLHCRSNSRAVSWVSIFLKIIVRALLARENKVLTTAFYTITDTLL